MIASCFVELLAFLNMNYSQRVDSLSMVTYPEWLVLAALQAFCTLRLLKEHIQMRLALLLYLPT
jgi:hypothetical protein